MTQANNTWVGTSPYVQTVAIESREGMENALRMSEGAQDGLPWLLKSEEAKRLHGDTVWEAARSDSSRPYQTDSRCLL